MHRPRIKSTSNIQDEEIPNIEAHYDFINRVLKWSISNLDRFISLLRARVGAEEAYIASLAKITKTHLVPDTEAAFCLGDTDTTFHKATAQYERSLGQIMTTRRVLIQAIYAQIDILCVVKEKQESRRKKVKMLLHQNNTDYITFRTREIGKLHAKYSTRCIELQDAQSQLQQQVQQNNQNLTPNDTESRDGDSGRLSSEEPRPRHSADNDSMSSSLGDSSTKKMMTNFMAQMRSQITSAANANAAQEVSKQNARCARLATEISTADVEYRDGIRKLEILRRKQIESATISQRQVETVLTDKTEAAKAAMNDMVMKERAALAEESRINDYVARAVDDIDSKRDIFAFNTEYQKKRFIQPSVIYYKNFTYGVARELLFGSSLVEYANEHKCTVPLIVYKCIDAVERMGGLQKEGIYRISGRQSKIDHLKSMFEQNEQGLDLEQTKFDVFTIASVLKVYLRELKEPLFHFGYQTRVEYATLERQSRLTRLQSKIASLAKVQRDTLHVLMRHLAMVNKNSQTNKMNLQNLSVVFTPTIFQDRSGNSAPGEWHGDSVFEDMLVYHETLFHNAEIQSRLNSNATNNASAVDMNPTGHGWVGPPPLPAPTNAGVFTPTSASISANTGMLLTAPLNPSNLGISDDSQGGCDSYYQQHQSMSQQQRSMLLTSIPTINQQEKHKVPPIPEQSGPLPAQQQQQQQQQIPPRSASSSKHTSPAPSSKTEDVAVPIGKAAMGGSLEPRVTESHVASSLRGLRTDTRPSVATTVRYKGEDDIVSPISPSEAKQIGDGVPQRQDSLRIQVGHQQVQQQQLPPPPRPPAISTSPIPTNSTAAAAAAAATTTTNTTNATSKPPPRPSPTGPQTPTITIEGAQMAHTPSTATIVEANYAAPQQGLQSGAKHLDEGDA